MIFPEAKTEGDGIRYFEEQPLLPHPMNYIDVKVTSNSSSSSNGRITTAVYGFEPRSKTDKAKKLLDQYIDALKGAGLKITGSSNEYVIMSGSTILAKIALEKEVIRVTLIP